MSFLFLAGAILLFYGLAGQPRARLWLVAKLISLFGFLLAACFLLAYDWHLQPVEIGLINRVAVWWMSLRARLGLAGLPPFPPIEVDVIAGILVVLAPFPFALGLHGWRLNTNEDRLSPERDAVEPLFPFHLLSTVHLGFWPGVISGLVILVAIFLSAERGPWLALAGTGALWAWWAASEPLSALLVRPHKLVFVSGLLLISLLFIVLVLGGSLDRLYPGGLKTIADALPGPSQVDSRLEVWRNTLHLLADFPFTGGGLQAFPGLYSHYILYIPFSYLESSHNLFLEVAIQQGPFGLFALLLVLGGSICLLWAYLGHRDEFSPLRGATLSGLVVLILYGLVDNILYPGFDVLFLFLLPGLAVATSRATAHAVTTPSAVARLLSVRRPVVYFRLALILGAFFVLTGWHRQLQGSWYANRGAVYMARSELAGFPSGEWGADIYSAEVSPAIDLFEKALQIDPHQPTAHFRLGMVANQVYDFPTAVRHLEKAHPERHPGVRKALGYSYVWLERFDAAEPILRDFPQARKELIDYAVWWERLQRSDLAEAARQMWAILYGS